MFPEAVQLMLEVGEEVSLSSVRPAGWEGSFVCVYGFSLFMRRACHAVVPLAEDRTTWGSRW